MFAIISLVKVLAMAQVLNLFYHSTIQKYPRKKNKMTTYYHNKLNTHIIIRRL